MPRVHLMRTQQSQRRGGVTLGTCAKVAVVLLVVYIVAEHVQIYEVSAVKRPMNARSSSGGGGGGGGGGRDNSSDADVPHGSAECEAIRKPYPLAAFKDDDKSVLIHLHVAKSGGSFIDQLFKRECKRLEAPFCLTFGQCSGGIEGWDSDPTAKDGEEGVLEIARDLGAACGAAQMEQSGCCNDTQKYGPTSFAPLLDAAVETVKAAGNAYHILVIVCDGQVTSVKATRAALVRASHVPLSVICVGVGDGPFDEMKFLDDGLPERLFDNFQFVHFEEVCGQRSENPEVAFALAATMELPVQYDQIKKLGLL